MYRLWYTVAHTFLEGALNMSILRPN